MAGEHILIVDVEPAIQSTLKGVLEDEGYRVSAVGSGAEALARVAEDGPDLVFLDIWMSGMDGLETLEKIKRLRAEAAVVMISGHGTIETAVKATKLGAYDFIEKPLSLEKTLLTAARALEHARLARENAQLRERLDLEWDIVGQSPVMQAVRQQIATAAPTTGRVLIHGENGSGKQLVARAIHPRPPRADRPGRVREDLFYRLNVIPIEVPPLRERKEDVPLLINHFIARFAAENGKRPKTVSVEALAYFLSYDWPGNIRELRNMVERLVIMTPGDIIGPDDLP